jgi:hypothetical protein
MVYDNYCRSNNVYGMNIHWTPGFHLDNGYKDWDCVPDVGNFLGLNNEVQIAQCSVCREQDYYSLKAQCVMNPTTTTSITTTTLSSTTTTQAGGAWIIRGCGDACRNDCISQGNNNLCSASSMYTCVNACPACGVTTTQAYKTCAAIGQALSTVFYDSAPSGYTCQSQYFTEAGKYCYYSCTTQTTQPVTTTTLPTCDNKCKQLGYQWGTCSEQVISGSSLSIFGLCGQFNCWCGYFTTTTQPVTTTTMPGYCGDGICSSGENCPNDCGTGNPWYVMPVLIIGALAMVGAGIYYYQKKRK